MMPISSNLTRSTRTLRSTSATDLKRKCMSSTGNSKGSLTVVDDWTDSDLRAYVAEPNREHLRSMVSLQ